MRRSALFLALLSLVCLSVPASAQFGGRGGKGMNPFGSKGPMGYSLGPIGGKATELKAAERATYRLTSGQSGLKVVSVDASGPGQKAGLAVGDVIVGVGKMTFSDKTEAVYQLAVVIEKLYARRGTGVLALRVWRGGKITVVKIAIKGRGRKWADSLMTGSFNYLIKEQQSGGNFGSAVNSNNAQVATTAICGLALLAAGGKPGAGDMGKAITSARNYLVKTTGNEQKWGMGGRGGGTGGMGGRMGGSNNSQVNWSLGYGALFLAEYYRHTGDAEVKTKLVEVFKAIAKNQEANGGWAHGPGGANALGYTDFAAVTSVCLAGYGAIARAVKELKVSEQVVSKALNYYQGTASGDGGIGYSQRAGQKGMGDPGRTASAIFALSMCGKKKHPFVARMSSYFKRNMKDVPEGHASPVFHFGMGALGSWECAASKSFLAMFRYELLMARQLDGSFSARPSKEDKMWGRKSDSLQGPCWPTGTYLLAWNLGRGKLKLFGKRRR